MNRRPRRISKGCMKVEGASLRNFEDNTRNANQPNKLLGGDKQFQ
jgi:hypothetical protein